MTTKRREPVDMSAPAIARRLEDVRQLYRLMLATRQFELVGSVAGDKRDSP